MAGDTLWHVGKPIEAVAQDIRGKTIAEVSLEYVRTGDGGTHLSAETITFTDGTRLWFAVDPYGGDVCIDLVYPMPDPKPLGGEPTPPPPGSGVQ